MIDYLVKISRESYRLVKEQFFQCLWRHWPKARRESRGSSRTYQRKQYTSSAQEDSDEEGEDVMEIDDEEEHSESETEEDCAFLDDEMDEVRGSSF